MSSHRNTQQTDPLDLAETFAESKGWKLRFDDDIEDVMYIVLPGRYTTPTLQMQWEEEVDMLVLRINSPMPEVPDYATSEFHNLLNMMNSKCLIGSWFAAFYEEIGEVLVWRHVVHTDQSLLDESHMNNLILHSIRVHDEFYPVFSSFFSAKPKMVDIDGQLECIALGMSPEQAMCLIDDLKSFGRA